MIRFFLLTVAFTSAVVLPVAVTAGKAEDLCCLCNGCAPVVYDRGDFRVDADGTTCNELFLEMVDKLAPHSRSCQTNQSRYRKTCCDQDFDPGAPVDQNPTPAPESKFEPSNHPPCDLCHNGSYPARPFSTIVAVLDGFIPKYPGSHTCDDLYWLGLTGNIVDRACNPLQDFAHVSCGCGKGPTRAPTGHPTRAPTMEPTLAPTVHPTVDPTRSPTKDPTRRPTASPTEQPTTARPITLSPTNDPTEMPTDPPMARPTKSPTGKPTEHPTASPTRRRTVSPTRSPLRAPTAPTQPSNIPPKKPVPDSASSKDEASKLSHGILDKGPTSPGVRGNIQRV